MNKKRLLFIANWKMNMSFLEAKLFISSYMPLLQSTIENTDSEVVICPSFITLSDLCIMAKNSSINIGAQNCSEYESGAYTGEVDALSLASVGCTYTIVGHSERRTYFNETNHAIGQKILQLQKHNITPILCIGETEQDHIYNKTYDALIEQLNPIMLHAHYIKKIIIAYEPIWAIGTQAPDILYLNKIFKWLTNYCTQIIPNITINFIYGGGVNENNAAKIIAIPEIQGFILGKESLEFQKFQNIVLLSNNAITLTK